MSITFTVKLMCVSITGPITSADSVAEETYINTVPEIRDREELIPPSDCVYKAFVSIYPLTPRSHSSVLAS